MNDSAFRELCKAACEYFVRFNALNSSIDFNKFPFGDEPATKDGIMDWMTRAYQLGKDQEHRK